MALCSYFLLKKYRNQYYFNALFQKYIDGFDCILFWLYEILIKCQGHLKIYKNQTAKIFDLCSSRLESLSSFERIVSTIKTMKLSTLLLCLYWFELMDWSISYKYLFAISYCQIMSILVAYGNLSISATTNLRLWFIHNKQRTVACALAISLTFILLLENSCNFISIINYFYWFVFISTEYLNI